VPCQGLLELLLAGAGGEVELGVECGESEGIVVHTVAGRWTGAAVSRVAEVVAALARCPLALAETATSGVDSPGEPVREGAARRVRIIDDERERTGIRRRFRPRKRRRPILAVAAVLCGDRLSVLEGVASQGEGLIAHRSGHMPEVTAGTPEDLVAAAHVNGVRDPLVLGAVRDIPRAGFVPAAVADRAYDDRPLPIAHDQVTTQPSLVAAMVEALALGESDTVLEIGTGLGWQTALLARLARTVWSVERFDDLAADARANLAREGVANATVVVGDGTGGLPEAAPFDAILVAAAYTGVPAPLVTQLADGGRLVQPLGLGGAEDVVLFERSGAELVRRRTVIGAHFVRLVGEHGFAEQ
jgi:protein-L-isoaspartate(D-aspartate) O-methyltransferase